MNKTLSQQIVKSWNQGKINFTTTSINFITTSINSTTTSIPPPPQFQTTNHKPQAENQIYLELSIMKICIILSTALALFTTSTSALGTNCFGHKLCQRDGCQLSDVITIINRQSPDRGFGSGELIGCCGASGKGKLCAYIQHTNRVVYISEIQRHIKTLYNFGCRRCGSVAFDGRDVFKGELTVAYRPW